MSRVSLSPPLVFAPGIVCGLVFLGYIHVLAVIMLGICLIAVLLDDWRASTNPIEPETTWTLAALAVVLGWMVSDSEVEQLVSKGPAFDLVTTVVATLWIALLAYVPSARLFSVFINDAREDRADPRASESEPIPAADANASSGSLKRVDPLLSRLVCGGLVLTLLGAALVRLGIVDFVALLAFTAFFKLLGHVLARLASGAWRRKGWLPQLSEVWPDWKLRPITPEMLSFTAIIWVHLLIALGNMIA